MRNLKFTFLILPLLLLMQNKGQAQCISPSQYGSGTINSSAPGTSLTITTCNYGGEYANVTFNATGSFTYASSVSTDYLTVTDASNNILIFGPTPLAVTIPSVGLYRMHVSASAPPACTTQNTCRTTSIYVPLMPCSGTPTPGTVPASFSICPNTQAMIQATGATAASGITYQWMQSPNGVSGWTNVSASTATTTALTTPSLTTLTYYQMVVTCSSSAQSATTAVLSVNPNNPPSACYCNTNLGGSGCSGDYIYNVSIMSTSFNNTSACNSTTLNGTYSIFAPSATTSATLTAGATYSISVNTTANNIESLWIDYNQNGVFDASEHTQLCTTSTPSVPTVVSFNVPLSAMSGVTGMRVRSRATGNPNGPTDACTSFGSGECEDYVVTISPAVACSGTPNAGTATATSTMVCSGSTVNISLSGSTVASGLTYQWQSSPNGITWTSVPGATVMTINQNVTATTYYQAIVSCSSNTAVSVPVQVTVLAAPVYASVPFLENFDNTWQNRCDTRNVPVAANWSSNPTTGNNSWRRQDDGASAMWTSSTGTNTPLSGAGCADFSSYWANGTTGDLDLYVDMGTTNNYQMYFYNQNISGSDSLEVFLSTNGGLTFTKKRGFTLATNWTKQTINLGAVNSPSCVVRFRATGDYGNDNIGMDSLVIRMACTAPTVNVVSSASVVCAGNSVNLNATGATSYTWSTGATTQSISVTPSVSTVYTVTGSTGGCPASKSISITVNASPSVSAVTSNSLLCVGQSATLTANGAATYTWNTGGTGASIVVTPSVSTTYTVIGTNTVGCSGMNSISQTVSTCTGIEAILAGNEIRIFPNPNSGAFNVVVPDVSAPVSIEIMDALGKAVMNKTLTHQQTLINIADLPNGVYMYTIKNERGVMKQGKLIKQ